MKHVLKTHGTVWDAVESGAKRFESRRDDRFFQRGDTVVLRQLDTEGGYSSQPGGSMFSTRDLTFTIGWMLRGEQYGVLPGYVVFQLEPLATQPGDGGRS